MLERKFKIIKMLTAVFIFLTVVNMLMFISTNLSGCGVGDGGGGTAVKNTQGVIMIKGMLSVKPAVSKAPLYLSAPFESGVKITLVDGLNGGKIDETTVATDGSFLFSGDFRGKMLSIKPQGKGSIILGTIASDFPLNSTIMVSFPFDGIDGGFDETAIIASNLIKNKKAENKVIVDVRDGIPMLWDTIKSVKKAVAEYVVLNPEASIERIVEASVNPAAPETRALIAKVTLPAGSLGAYSLKTESPRFAGENIAVTITAKDGYGELIREYNGNVILSIPPSSGAVLWSGAGVTDNKDGTAVLSNGFTSGVAVVYIKSETASDNVMLNVSDLTSGVSGTTGLSWIACELESFKVEIFSDSTAAGAAINMCITALNSAGRVETSFNSSAALADTTNTLAPSITGNFVNGVWNGAVTINRAAPHVNISVAAAGKTGVSGAFAVTSGAAAKIKFITALPEAAKAGEAFYPQPVIGVYDVYDNNVALYDGTIKAVAMSDSGNKLSGGVEISSSDGKFSYSDLGYNCAESIKIMFQTVNFPIIETKMITVRPSSIAEFSVSANSPQYAGTPITLNIKALDSYSNVITDYKSPGVFTLEGAGGEAVWSGDGVSDGSGNAGSYDGTGFLNGYATVNVSYPFELSGAAARVADLVSQKNGAAVVSWLKNDGGTGISGLDSFEITVNSTQIIAGTPFSLTIIARDAKGGALSSYNSFVNLSDITATITPAITGNFTNGVWSGNVMITKAAADNVINVNAAGKSGVSRQFMIGHGTPARLVITQQPSAGALAGMAFAVQPKVSVTDALGNMCSGDNMTVITAARGTAGSGSLSGTLTASAANGMALFSGLKYINAENMSITFSAPGFSSIESSLVAISPGPLDGFSVSTNSPQFKNGAIMITVKARDAYHNIVKNYISPGMLNVAGVSGTITWSGDGVSDGAAGAGTYDGTGFANGICFLSVSNSAPDSSKTITITDTFSGKTGTAAVSWLDAAGVGALDRFEISSVNNVSAGSGIALTITAKDASGGTVTGFNSAVSLSDRTDTISPVMSGNFVNGVWSGNVVITKTRAQNIIMAVAAGKLGITNTFEVTAGAASKLVMVRQPSFSCTAGSAFLTQPRVAVCDSYDNTAAGDNATVITAARGASGVAALQGTLSATAVNGIATFTNLSYNKAETMNIAFSSGSLSAAESYNISVMAGSLDGFTLDSTSPQFAGSAIGLVIKARDAWQNVISNYSGAGSLNLAGASGSVTWSGTGVTDGADPGGTYSSSSFVNGAASISVSNTNADSDKTAVITDTASGKSGSATLAWINNTGFDHFAVSAIATPQAAGASIAITITAQDSSNDTVAYNSTASLGDTTGTISPNVTGVFVNGVWSGNVTITKAQPNIMISVSAAGKTGGSNLFTVNPAAAAKLVINREPSNTATSATAFAVQPKISVADTFGNILTGDNATIITAARGSAGSAALSGTLTATVSGGIATFTDLKYNKAENLKINFTSGALEAIESGLIIVSPGALDNFALSASGPAIAGSPITLYLKARDAQGNIITGYNSAGTLTIAGTTGGITWSGDGVTDGVDPAGTFDGTGFNNGIAQIIVIDTAADSNKTVSVTSGGKTAGINLSWITDELDRFEISEISSPQNGGVPFSITITAKDAHGNTVTSYNTFVYLTDVTQTISPAVTGNFTNGVWSGNVTMTASNAADVITATAAGKSGISNPFKVELCYFVITSRVVGNSDETMHGWDTGVSTEEGGHVELCVTAKNSDGTTKIEYANSGVLTIASGQPGVVSWEGDGVTDNVYTNSDNNAVYDTTTFTGGIAYIYLRNSRAGNNLAVTVIDGADSAFKGSINLTWTAESTPSAFEFEGENIKGFRKYYCVRDSSVKMIKIPAGPFERGDGKYGGAATTMRMSSYYIAESHTTNQQFKNWRNSTLPPGLQGSWSDPGGYYDHPAVYVTWNDAKRYSYWLMTGLQSAAADDVDLDSKYLQTEAQYEKAARGVKFINFTANNSANKIFPWGNTAPEDDVLCNTGYASSGGERDLDAGKGTLPVTQNYNPMGYYGKTILRAMRGSGAAIGGMEAPYILRLQVL